jgi:hypothetical protein
VAIARETGSALLTVDQTILYSTSLQGICRQSALRYIHLTIGNAIGQYVGVEERFTSHVSPVHNRFSNFLGSSPKKYWGLVLLNRD